MDPSWVRVICYAGVYYVIAALLLCCVARIRKTAPKELSAPKRILLIPAILSVGVGIALPLLHRLIPTEAPSLVWECDSVLLFFEAFVEKWSIWDFTKYSVLHKPGVLAASAHTLFWGAPTYAVMQWFGWSNFTFLSLALLLGTASVLVGYRINKLLFNTGVALCFVIIFAVNPSLIFNMGYGVSQTGTLFALLVAILFTFRTLLGRGALWINAPLAAVFLFGATLNYGPGRVFVVATLLFLTGVTAAAIILRRIDKRVALAAFAVLSLTGASLIIENRLNGATDFTSMRGEHAFHQHHWKENLIRVLGDTPEVRALDPENLPTSVRARFIFNSGLLGLEQFADSFSPIARLEADRRGYDSGNEVRPYQSGLIIFIIIGACISVWNALRSLLGYSADRALSHWFVLSLFTISLAPLVLVNRLDQHRSFLLVFPLSMWAALGMWTCVRRMYTNGFTGFLVGPVALALSIALSASVWRIFGAQEYRDPNMSSAFKHFATITPPADVLGNAGLICQNLAHLDFTMENMSRAQPDIQREFLHHLFLNNFTDQFFNAQSASLQTFVNQYRTHRLAFVSRDPMTKFEQAIRAQGFSIEKAQFGEFYSWLIQL